MYRALMIAAAMTISGPVSAQQAGMYFGLGFGYADMGSTGFGPPGATAEGGLLGLTAGYRGPAGGSGFYALEADADFADNTFEFSGAGCDLFADAPYYCKTSAVLRLRAIYGVTTSSGWEVFGSGGYGMVFGDAAIQPSGQSTSTTTGGFTFGLGAQKAFGGGTARLEVIRDNFTENVSGGDGYDTTYEATTLKATYLFSF